ncbi:protein-vacuolar targeting-related protein [Kockovaella imperatae]|uniref:Autophagy-related protein n=1 Tax=Kockovaella imperatae TaxID=4999 RepID=A0A1Y1UTB2_9TREE|nr:protein-vacuolar targeting-related protein [Kockovaella imperatae]ORX41263.1 protein-vacuolar targeting-related protein [Kockovaella imperatae]
MSGSKFQEDSSDGVFPEKLGRDIEGGPVLAGSLISDEATLFASPLPITGNRKTTTRKELWSWYLYYVGNSGLGPFNFAISAWQNLLYLQGWDPAYPQGTVPCGSGACSLTAYGQVRSINSIVLISNGLSFAIQAVIFLFVGSFADYGIWRPWITTVFTVLGWAVSFAWLGVEQPSQWQAGTALYIIGLISYQGALTFWTAAFPGLARDLPEVKASEEALQRGEVDRKTHDDVDMLARNRLADVSFFVCSIGELVVLAILAGILEAIVNPNVADSNTKALSIVCAYSAGVWIVCAAPWFLWEQYRPGNQLPPNTSYLTVGIKQIYHACRLCRRLKQTFLYLGVYFFLGDCLNTVVTVIATLQNEVVSYDTKTLNYLLIDGIAAQAIGIGIFWLIQKKWTISTKTMLLVNAFFILMLCAWGCIGITQTKFGFHNAWEFWAYQAFYGVFVCPWYAVSQAMISEVVPRGKEFLFFALFSIIGKTSSFVGPFVSSAIIEDSGNVNMPFTFLLGLGAISTFALFFVNVDKSRRECRQYLEDEAVRVYKLAREQASAPPVEGGIDGLRA